MYAETVCHVHYGRRRKVNDQQLQKLVEEISHSFFNKPFKHKAMFNNRLRTTGGRYMLESHNIEINRKYLEQLGMDELIGIIKHELCHYHLHLEGKGYRHRDKDFKELLKKVGGPRYCRTLPERPTRKRNHKIYRYICMNCQTVYERKRSMDINKYVCGKCHGNIVIMK